MVLKSDALVKCGILIQLIFLIHQLHVELFLGSLDPDSVWFVQNELGNVYDDLKDHVEFSFIPFGNADSVNNTEFICQYKKAKSD